MVVPIENQRVSPRRKGGRLLWFRIFARLWGRIRPSPLIELRTRTEEPLQGPQLRIPYVLALPPFLLLSLGIGYAFLTADFWWYRNFSLPEAQPLARLLIDIDRPFQEGLSRPAVAVRDVILPVTFTLHRLAEGESLSVVAHRYGISVGTIISWNQITNARRLPAGLELEIPSQEGIRYVVRRGDSLSSIAQEKRIPYNAILDANNLESPVLTPGQVLFLPGAALSRSELRAAMGELFIFPARGRITSRFGWRRDPFTGIRSFHNGIDIANQPGTPVVAAKEGIVVDTGYHSVLGNYVVINHDMGYQTLYGHLQSFSVSRGQRVNQGQVIGRMGNTGYSTGNHLHFTVLLRNKEIDPMRVLY